METYEICTQTRYVIQRIPKNKIKQIKYYTPERKWSEEWSEAKLFTTSNTNVDYGANYRTKELEKSAYAKKNYKFKIIEVQAKNIFVLLLNEEKSKNFPIKLVNNFQNLDID